MAKAVAAATWTRADALREWAQNPRRNDAAVEPVARSIWRFGFGAPLVVRDDDSEIIAGHTRLKAFQYCCDHVWVEPEEDAAGYWRAREPSDGVFHMRDAPAPAMVPVRAMALTAEEAHALALADNKLGEIAEWDEQGLADVLAELGAVEVDTTDLGWDPQELDALAQRTTTVSEHQRTKPGDNAPPLDETVVYSVPGQVYELGPHRLMCGDSTDPEAWDRLLDGDLVEAVWTDPPYGVSYKGGPIAEMAGVDRIEIANDGLDPSALRVFLRSVMTLLAERCRPGAVWYVSGPAGPLSAVFTDVVGSLGIWRWTLVWVKDRLVLGRADYHHRHEPILYGWVPGGPHYFINDRTQDTIFEVPRPGRSSEHPTMKPIALVERQLANSTKPGWVVADAFGGSGTTLMAAAGLGLRARLMEMEPGYCDVIRRRYTAWARENDLDPGPGALDPLGSQ